MKKLTEKIIAERIKKEYPNGTDLTYIDYNENLNDSKDLMEELASTGFIDSFYEHFDNWDSESEAIKYIKKEVFTEDEIEEIEANDDLSQAVEDICRDIDTSTPIKDLLENTSRRFFYYDLDFELENFDGFQDVEKESKKIAKKLKIDYKKHEEELRELVANAGYGGNLCILFTCDPIDLMGEKEKYIKFSRNYDLCIMDRCQGSGHSVNFKTDVELTFKFIRENMHDDEGASGYSFSGDVCGLCKFDEADFHFTNKRGNAIAVKENETAKEFADREKRYEKTFKAGGCTIGDMKYGRHRNMEYINDYPCGSKCKDCGTFFID